MHLFVGQTAEVNGDQATKGGQRWGTWFKGNPLDPDDNKWMSGWLGPVAALPKIWHEGFDFAPYLLPQWSN